MLTGPDRLRQDPPRRAHRRAARPARRDHQLPRRPHQLRSRRPVPRRPAATSSGRTDPSPERSATGAICYLDEVVEARHDSLAILHSLTDHRRTLYLDRTGEAVVAPGRLHARVLVQPGVPQHAQGPEAVVPAAVRDARAGLPAARPRGRGARRRDRHRPRRRRAARALRDRDPQAPTRCFHLEPPSTRTLVTAAHLVAAGRRASSRPPRSASSGRSAPTAPSPTPSARWPSASLARRPTRTEPIAPMRRGTSR